MSYLDKTAFLLLILYCSVAVSWPEREEVVRTSTVALGMMFFFLVGKCREAEGRGWDMAVDMGRWTSLSLLGFARRSPRSDLLCCKWPSWQERTWSWFIWSPTSFLPWGVKNSPVGQKVSYLSLRKPREVHGLVFTKGLKYRLLLLLNKVTPYLLVVFKVLVG